MTRVISLLRHPKIQLKIYIKTVFCLLLLLVFSAPAASRISKTTREKLQRELPILQLSVGNPVLIRTFKQESRLELWIKPKSSDQYRLFRTYPICYYSGYSSAWLKPIQSLSFIDEYWLSKCL